MHQGYPSRPSAIKLINIPYPTVVLGTESKDVETYSPLDMTEMAQSHHIAGGTADPTTVGQPVNASGQRWLDRARSSFELLAMAEGQSAYGQAGQAAQAYDREWQDSTVQS